MAANLLHSELTDQIIGAFYDVYNQLGTGFSKRSMKTPCTLS